MLWNSSGDMDLLLLTCKSALLMGLTALISSMVSLLNSDHPDGGLVGDVWGVSWVSSRLGFLSLFISKSSLQSEALHQHLSYWTEHLSQYLPIKLCLLSILSNSSSVWEMVAANSGSVNTWGRYPKPSPLGTSVSELVLVLLLWLLLFCFLHLHRILRFKTNIWDFIWKYWILDL